MTTKHFMRGLCDLRGLAIAAVAALASLVASPVAAEATIRFFYINAPGVGFNDATPAAPVGGNPGTTIGAQRRFVFETAGRIWGASLNSSVTIDVLATFTALPCDANSGVLGSAGPVQIFKDFANAPRSNTWYHVALANKRAGVDLAPGLDSVDDFDIIAQFNSKLGQPGCLTGGGFYYGIDNNAAPNQSDLAAIVLHELGHGLSFATFSDGNGEFIDGSPSAWDHYMFDFGLRKTWANMTVAERLQSQLNYDKLAWIGPRTRNAVNDVLDQSGAAQLFAVLPGGQSDFVPIGASQFGPQGADFGAIGRIIDTASNGCSPFAAGSLSRQVALIDRGGCTFQQKVQNAQAAGAHGVLLVNNVPGGPPFRPFGDATDITIPSGLISQRDGILIREALAASNTSLGVAVLRFDESIFAGATFARAPLLYTPDPYEPGSSVSHFDISALKRNGGDLLMEPFATGRQALSVLPPDDLTLPLFKDLGW
jgi:hypothetical protein